MEKRKLQVVGLSWILTLPKESVFDCCVQRKKEESRPTKRDNDVFIFFVFSIPWKYLKKIQISDHMMTKTGKQALLHRKILLSTIAAVSLALALVISISVLFSHRNNFLLRDFVLQVKGDGVDSSSDEANEKIATSGPNSSTPADRKTDNQLLDGLLAPGFDEHSCLSRYTLNSYRRNSPHYKPSSYLLSKLREYEARHRHCAPYSASYNKTMEGLTRQDRQVIDPTEPECSYIFWTGTNGLGNRMLSIASAFLYAVLTNRVLLTNQGPDMDDLFCEPFLNTTWLLPSEFPIRSQFYDSRMVHLRSLGQLLKENKNETSSALPPQFLFLYLSYDYEVYDKMFYLDKHQGFLRQIPCLILISDQYFVPSLYMMSSFQEELDKLFPEKDSIFHHLGRYLFHPSNLAWGLITRSYHAYLADSDQRIGLQVRVVYPEKSPTNLVLDHLLSCTKKKNILPEVQENYTSSSPYSTPNKTTTKAVLITSLYSEYFANIREMYWTKPTINGDVVRVYQPSHEGYQHFGDNMHNVKALAEIYLLSLSDVLLTTSWSTFGYVAQGLGGLRPWIFYVPGKNGTYGSPVECRRAMSMDPCFHYPPYFDRRTERMQDVGPLGPFLRHCEDAGWGLKLVSPKSKDN